jgi:hypothetical protein
MTDPPLRTGNELNVGPQRSTVRLSRYSKGLIRLALMNWLTLRKNDRMCGGASFGEPIRVQ